MRATWSLGHCSTNLIESTNKLAQFLPIVGYFGRAWEAVGFYGVHI